jgi:glycosyltransferase involved in cell wall biosynthesis
VRIAHVSDSYLPTVGGIELHLAALASRQRQQGHHVDVVTCHPGPIELTRAGRVLHAGDGTRSIARFRRSTRSRAAQIVCSGHYDVVHVHAGLATTLGYTVAAEASRAGMPTVVTLHSLIGHLGPGYRSLDLAAGWRRWPVAWTAVSDAAARPLRRLLGPEATVSVLPNAVDASAWRTTPEARDPDDVVVAVVGRLTRRKRPLDLLRTMRRARQLVPDRIRLQVELVGDGPQRSRVERSVHRHRMEGWVRLPGWRSAAQLRSLYRRADLFVAPAILESFGIAALEARAAGIPVVAMARSGIAEFVDHGLGGLLVDDDNGMAQAIAALATDATRRRAMAAHNVSTPSPFDWPEVLEETEHTYARAAALHRAPVPFGRARPAEAAAVGSPG